MLKEVIKWFVSQYRNIRHPFKYTYESISNIIRWIPILWKDRDFDDWHIYTILEFKLKNQAKHISKHDRHTRSQEDASKMRLCVDLINKVKEGYYELEYMDYVKSEFSFGEPDENGLSELKIKTVSDNSTEYFNKHKSAYNRLLKDKSFYPNRNGELVNRSSDTQALHLSSYNHLRARKLLFKLLENNIEKWWD